MGPNLNSGGVQYNGHNMLWRRFAQQYATARTKLQNKILSLFLSGSCDSTTKVWKISTGECQVIDNQIRE